MSFAERKDIKNMGKDSNYTKKCAMETSAKKKKRFLKRSSSVGE